MTFAGDLQKFAEKTGRSIDQVVRSTVLQLGRSVVLMSPVDTGRFRANWHVNFDVPDRVTFPDVDKTGAGTIAEISAAMTDFRAGQVAYLINNLPYAIPLEYGSSKQAPGGMVRVTTARFQAAVREAVRTIK